MFEELHRKMNHFWNDDRTLAQTDPEYIALFSRFAYDEVVREPEANDPKLGEADRCLAIIAAIIGAQGMDAFEMMLPVAYRTGVTSVQLKEVIYQATPYAGFAHALPYLRKLNDFLNAENVAMPLPGQDTVPDDGRMAAGQRIETRLFGDVMRDFPHKGPEDTRHINAWLTDDCFGGYYTRGGLTLAQREMVTFCLLIGQGGCEAQERAHIRANLRLGNDEHFLIAVVSQCLPYIGYPRALNAIACIRTVLVEHDAEPDYETGAEPGGGASARRDGE